MQKFKQFFFSSNEQTYESDSSNEQASEPNSSIDSQKIIKNPSAEITRLLNETPGTLNRLKLVADIFNHIDDALSDEDDPSQAKKIVDILQKKYLEIFKSVIKTIRKEEKKNNELTGILEDCLTLVENNRSLLFYQTNTWQKDVIGYTHVSGEIDKLLQTINPRHHYLPDENPIIDDIFGYRLQVVEATSSMDIEPIYPTVYLQVSPNSITCANNSTFQNSATIRPHEASASVLNIINNKHAIHTLSLINRQSIHTLLRTKDNMIHPDMFDYHLPSKHRLKRLLHNRNSIPENINFITLAGNAMLDGLTNIRPDMQKRLSRLGEAILEQLNMASTAREYQTIVDAGKNAELVAFFQTLSMLGPSLAILAQTFTATVDMTPLAAILRPPTQQV